MHRGRKTGRYRCNESEWKLATIGNTYWSTGNAKPPRSQVQICTHYKSVTDLGVGSVVLWRPEESLRLAGFAPIGGGLHHTISGIGMGVCDLRPIWWTQRAATIDGSALGNPRDFDRAVGDRYRPDGLASFAFRHTELAAFGAIGDSRFDAIACTLPRSEPRSIVKVLEDPKLPSTIRAIPVGRYAPLDATTADYEFTPFRCLEGGWCGLTVKDRSHVASPAVGAGWRFLAHRTSLPSAASHISPTQPNGAGWGGAELGQGSGSCLRRPRPGTSSRIRASWLGRGFSCGRVFGGG